MNARIPRLAACLPCLFAMLCVHADESELPITDAADLIEWCRIETAAHFAAQGAATYNWRASWKERGNTLFVEGR
jgi:hypothetical protein